MRLVVVHMGPEERARERFRAAGLEGVDEVHDPEQRLYRAFGLDRAGPARLLAPRVWLRGFESAILRGHGFGKLSGDGLQMPGVFLLEGGRIVRAFRHQTPADRPDYDAMACSLPEP